MKKILSSVLAAQLLLAAAVIPAFADDGIGVGDYLEMGRYYGEPILWRCVDIDDNGPLMLADRIICLKPFDTDGSVLDGSHARGYNNGWYRQHGGSCYWGDSNIRSWLNSNESAGNVTWLCGNPPVNGGEYGNAYADEAGFETNFTARELEAVRTTEQDSLLMRNEYEDMAPYGSTEFTYFETKDTPAIEQLAGNARDGAYRERISDTFFLLDAVQANAVYRNRDILGEDYYIAKPTSGAAANADTKNGLGIDHEISVERAWPYWLRTPAACDGDGYSSLNIWIDGDVHSGAVYLGCVGVRPAFYLNDKAELYGSGSRSEPYRADEIAVAVNGSRVKFDVPPVIENDRTLVPMRAVFEALGAEIEWDGKTRTVTARRGDDVLSITIDSDKLYKNDLPVALDAPARIINDRTLVPIRAISESFDAAVDWDAASRSVIISTQTAAEPDNSTTDRLFDKAQGTEKTPTPEPMEIPAAETFADRLNEKMSAGKNYMFSPLSIKLALAMTANGAEGKTKEEILAALGINDLDAFNEYAKEITSDYTRSEMLTLNIANSIWLNRSSFKGSFKDSFADTIRDLYGGEAQTVSNDDAEERINSWVSERTLGRIPSIIEGNDFYTALINAVHFKGRWDKCFYAGMTEKDVFFGRNGEVQELDFMHQIDVFDHHVSGGMQIVRLPYQSTVTRREGKSYKYEHLPEISMYVIMSDRRIAPEYVINNADFQSRLINLSMPKFRSEYSDDVKEKLGELGISAAFSPASADFGSMLEGGKDSMTYIEKVLHKTYISVDEEGTEAAAATAVVSPGGAAPPKDDPIDVKIDRPFTYVIRDDKRGEILFVGEYGGE